MNLQLSAKSVGVFEAFYNSIKPITLVNQTVEIQKTGKLYHSLNYMLCVFVCVLLNDKITEITPSLHTIRFSFVSIICI